jgi:hypothetical protein
MLSSGGSNLGDAERRGAVDERGDVAAPSTAEVPSTPVTEAPTTTPGTNPIPSTTVSQLGPTGSPLLGRATGGLSVYAISGRSLARVDLDSGASTIASLAVPLVGVETSGFGVFDGRLFIGRDLELLAAPLDLSVVAEVVQSNVEVLVGGSRLVVRVMDPRTGASAVREIRSDGQVVREWSDSGASPAAHASFAWTPGLLGDRLIVMNAGRIYTVGDDGIRQYAIGEYLASNGQWLLWRGCNEAMQCAYHLGDPGDPFRRPVPLPAGRRDLGISLGPNGAYGPLIAPDGATIVVADDSGSPMLMRTDDGESLAKLDFSTRPTWTPDGEWVFTRSGGSTIVAISTRDGRQSSFTLRGLFGTQRMWLAVG